jgi:hypothetical protein
MTRRAQENLIAGIILAGFLAIIWMSLDYSPRSRMIPLPMSILGVILVSIQLVWQNLRSADDLRVDMLEFLTGEAKAKPAAAEPAARDDHGPARRGILGETAGYAIVAILLALFLVLGAIPATFLFTAGYLITIANIPWPKSLVYALILTASVTVLFGYLLQVQLDRSMLLPEFGQFIGL